MAMQPALVPGRGPQGRAFGLVNVTVCVLMFTRTLVRILANTLVDTLENTFMKHARSCLVNIIVDSRAYWCQDSACSCKTSGDFSRVSIEDGTSPPTPKFRTRQRSQRYYIYTYEGCSCILLVSRVFVSRFVRLELAWSSIDSLTCCKDEVYHDQRICCGVWSRCRLAGLWRRCDNASAG